MKYISKLIEKIRGTRIDPKTVWFKRILVAVLVLLVALGIFQAGVFVGYKKASVHYRIGEQYYGQMMRKGDRPRGDKSGQMMRGMMPPVFPGTNGIVGEVVSVGTSSIVVADPNGIEKVVLIGTTVPVKRFKEKIKVSEVNAGDRVVIIGASSATGEIQAELVRVMPEPTERDFR